MGQKVNPHGLRVGVIKDRDINDWNAHWYAEKDKFSDYLIEDKKIREFIMNVADDIARSNSKNKKKDGEDFKKKDDGRKNLAGISSITIDRTDAQTINVAVRSARSSLLIGDKGKSKEDLRVLLEKEFNKNVKSANKKTFRVSIVRIDKADSDAVIVAQNIAAQLENRGSFRRAMKRAMSSAMKDSAVYGIKVKCSGRLGGAEIARSETYHEGTIPLQTLRANIDYGFAEANTTYGRIGVKVWIYKGEVFPEKKSDNKEEGGLA